MGSESTPYSHTTADAHSVASRSGGCPRRIMVVAGEASSDEHAATVVRALRELHPNLFIFGMGGSHLRDAGMQIVVDSETHASVMGIVEVVGGLRRILQARRLLIDAAEQYQPELLILVDFPDFNLALARRLRSRGKMKVLYFISPQLWAWRRGRISTMKRYVDAVATILPFEAPFYLEHGVAAEFVGHPYLDRAEPPFDRESFLNSIGLESGEKGTRRIVALLPGSRKSEVERLLPPMLDAATLLQGEFPELQVVVPVATTLGEDFLRRHLGAADLKKLNVKFVRGQAREVLRASDAALVASGTATVEAALAGVPFAVVYKLAPLTYVLARLLVRGVKHFAMPNLIAGRQIVPELLQAEVTPERLAAEVRKLLGDPALRERMIADLQEVRTRLAREADLRERGNAIQSSAGKRTAQMALRLIGEKVAIVDNRSDRLSRELLVHG